MKTPLQTDDSGTGCHPSGAFLRQFTRRPCACFHAGSPEQRNQVAPIAAREHWQVKDINPIHESDH